MKIALVHDYLKEFGGAERVLKVLSEIYPKAPIYTAFSVKGSTAEKEFRDRKIVESWLAPLLKVGKLYSPLRFLTPLIWRSFDLSDYDLVITSCSWYITRGFKIGPKTKVVAYCHTPPRWLYGYETSVGFQKYWPVKIYAAIVGHFLRMYDYATAQEPKRNPKSPASPAGGQIPNPKIIAGVDYFIANSKNVQKRIKKFYRRESTVIYPPVEVEKIMESIKNKQSLADFVGKQKTINKNTDNYFLIVSRLVGAKGLEEAAKAIKSIQSKFKDKQSLASFAGKLKIVGEAHGFSDVEKRLKKLSGGNVELLGWLDDTSIYRSMAKAKGFIALARDEDFGMTVVEAMAAGTPVIAFNGGGYRESVIEGVTGIFIDDTDEKTIAEAISKFNRVKWDKNKLQKQAMKFSKERFVREFNRFVQRLS